MTAKQLREALYRADDNAEINVFCFSGGKFQKLKIASIQKADEILNPASTDEGETQTTPQKVSIMMTSDDISGFPVSAVELGLD